VFLVGKSLELMAIVLLAAGLYLGCANPYALSEDHAMGIEMASLAVGIVFFFVGRLLEKR
jgi:hypothetical protein